MNDYWNDPPEVEELPECCDEVMEFNEVTMTCTCLKCGKSFKQPEDIGDENVTNQNEVLVRLRDELADVKRERDEGRKREMAAILERERWKMRAEEKWSMRRELEEILGVESSSPCDDHLAKGLESLRELIRERDEARDLANAAMLESDRLRSKLWRSRRGDSTFTESKHSY